MLFALKTIPHLTLYLKHTVVKPDPQFVMPLWVMKHFSNPSTSHSAAQRRVMLSGLCETEAPILSYGIVCNSAADLIKFTPHCTTLFDNLLPIIPDKKSQQHWALEVMPRQVVFGGYVMTVWACCVFAGVKVSALTGTHSRHLQ